MSKTTTRWLLVVAIAVVAPVVIVAAPPTATITDAQLSDAQRQAADQAAALIRQGKHRDAFTLVVSLRKSFGRSRHAVAEGLMAQIALLERQPARAVEFAAPFVADRDGYQPIRAHCIRQGAYAQLALDHHAAAADLFNWLIEREDGGDAVNQVLAAEGLARVELARQRFGPAVEALDFATRQLRAVEARLRYAKLDDPRLAGVADRLGALLADARRRHDLERFGPDYTALRDADRLRIDLRYMDALAAYRKLIADSPDSPFADAARLYEPICMAALGGAAQAQRKLEAFIDADPFGPHRGEALWWLARIDLERRADPDAALARFKRLADWIAEARKPDHRLDPPSVSPEALAVARPPADRQWRDFWGNDHTRTAAPGQLLTRATADWYLDDLESRCMSHLALLYIVAGQPDDARRAASRLLALDPATRRLEAEGEWNDYRRLMFGVEHGYLVAMPAELALYNRRHRLLVTLADFYYITRRFADADRLAADMLDGKYGPLSEPQRDYLHLARAQSLCWTHGRLAATPHYQAVLAHRDNTLTEQRAALALGLIHLQSGALDRQLRGIDLLNNLMRSSSRNEFVFGARIALARTLHRAGQTARAIRTLRAMPRSAGDHRALADYYIQLWSR